VPGLEEEYLAYLRLRANVYAGQMGFIGANHVRSDGTERDQDDDRSVHFGLYEQDPAGARAIGSMRLIVKSDEAPEPLPVESFFPEVFADAPAPSHSVEVSRYIMRHETRPIQHRLSPPLFSRALAHVMTHNLGPLYGVIEPGLERALGMRGLPIERIATPRYVPKYATHNLGIVVHAEEFARQLEQTHPGILDAIRRQEETLTYFTDVRELRDPAFAA
jgi:N-acyl-L-homoserine lactone synthetase